MESVGQRLKKIRQELGLSLQDVHKKTKLQMNILQAIEGDSVSDISPVYLKGFIKIYCNFLGQDPKDFEVSLAKPGAVKKAEFTPAKESLQRSTGGFKPELPPVLIKIIISAAAVLAAFFILSHLGKIIFKRKPLARPAKAQSSASLPAQAVKPLTTKPQGVPAAKVQAKPVSENAQGLNLVVFAKEKCMLKVKADGKVLFHRVMEKGRSERWTAVNRIEFFAANAAAVELYYNTQHFPKLGERGKPVNILITSKEGLTFSR
jgi:cytoskeletal protein RodZ